MVDAWRDKGYRRATTVSRRLLHHWRSEDNVPRLFFAQVEALETIIWITEAARSDDPRRAAIEDAAREHNDGIVRYCTKMATGTGKTAVMGMVIAWNAANMAAGGNRRHPGRYFTLFVAITPGHTVRERLAVLDPSSPDNVYDELSLVPAGLRGDLGRVKLRVVNFQAFQCRDRLGEATGDARRLLRRGDAGRDPETPAAMLRRVLRGLPERAKVCVLNDEAHHCYLPEEGRRTGSDADENKSAALWFSALAALRDEGRLGRVHDFSATPMFIQTAASARSEMFPWAVSDFPLMDGIESGLVKIPRVPVDDDSDDREVVWRNLYRNTNPKTIRSDSVPPSPLGDALGAMYEQYDEAHERWGDNGLPTPPVFIVVANTIANAEALYPHIAGWVEHTDDGAVAHRPGAYELFSNIRSDGSGYEDHLRTLLVHSKMEGDDTISASSRLGRALKTQATQLRVAGATGDDRDVIRKALNTVGRPGGLGEQIRCVVSVSMLTEGWDTRTVVHILGFRAFGTQLLCEQVTGRALRRSNYDSFDGDGRLTPEFADVLGVPFDFMPVTGSADPAPPKPRYRVFTMSGRRQRRIEFPALTGYMIEPASPGVDLDSRLVPSHIVSSAAPSMAELAGVAGKSEVIATSDDPSARHQQVVVQLAADVTRRLADTLAPDASDPEPTQPRRRRLFLDAVRAVRAWLDHPAVHCDDIAWLLRSEQQAAAAQAITEGVSAPHRRRPDHRHLRLAAGVRHLGRGLRDQPHRPPSRECPAHHPAQRAERGRLSLRLRAARRQGPRPASRRGRLGAQLPPRLDRALRDRRRVASLRARLRGAAVRRAPQPRRRAPDAGVQGRPGRGVRGEAQLRVGLVDPRGGQLAGDTPGVAPLDLRRAHRPRPARTRTRQGHRTGQLGHPHPPPPPPPPEPALVP